LVHNDIKWDNTLVTAVRLTTPALLPSHSDTESFTPISLAAI
jgi:hypothetical protein